MVGWHGFLALQLGNRLSSAQMVELETASPLDMPHWAGWHSPG
jgi:hypothetical protein